MLQLYVMSTYIGSLILWCVQDPDLISALSDPEVMAALQDGMSYLHLSPSLSCFRELSICSEFYWFICSVGTAGRVMQSLLDNRLKLWSESTIYTGDEIENLILCLQAQFLSWFSTDDLCSWCSDEESCQLVQASEQPEGSPCDS